MPKHHGLKVDDLARVIQSGGGLGPTLYVVEFVGERGHCIIREAGNPLSGGQEFDTSCLQKVERDERVARYSREQKLIQLWLSPNQFGTREAKGWKDAERLVKQTGIKQTLVNDHIAKP